MGYGTDGTGDCNAGTAAAGERIGTGAPVPAIVMLPWPSTLGRTGLWLIVGCRGAAGIGWGSEGGGDGVGSGGGDSCELLVSILIL